MRIDGNVQTQILLFFLTLPLKGSDRIRDHSDIEVKAHALDVSRLRTTQEVTGASDLQISLSNCKTRTQISVLGDRLQALVRHL